MLRFTLCAALVGLLASTVPAQVQFCSPGNAGIVSCPCGNPQVPAGAMKGCDNFSGGGTGGATLAGSGTASVSTDTLQLQFANGVGAGLNGVILYQGTVATINVRSGAGVRCVGGSLKRLYTRSLSTGGSVTYPDRPNDPVHVDSESHGYGIIPPLTLYYYCSYRNSAANGTPGCPGFNFGFNTSNAVAIDWIP